MSSSLKCRIWYKGNIGLFLAREQDCQEEIRLFHDKHNPLCVEDLRLRCAADIVVHCMLNGMDESWKAKSKWTGMVF